MSTVPEDEYLQLSGIQHYVFCPRQWALIHIEQEWADNERTVDGEIVHERCHDESIREKRGDVMVIRGLKIVSHRLKLAGVCDVVEFHRSLDGVPLHGEEGLYLPVPIEYKRGKSKSGDEDRAQVCAQAMALEEMFCCKVPLGYLYYAEVKRRDQVVFDDELRSVVVDAADKMNTLFSRGYTPRLKSGKKCKSCSMRDACEPGLGSVKSVRQYIDEHISEVNV